MSDQKHADNWLLYDGYCPFCSAYVKRVRLKESLGTLRLIDARDRSQEKIEEVGKKGLDPDVGMVLKIDDQIYHGADAVHVIALLTTSSDFFNRLNARLFRSKSMSRLIYPALVFGRRAALMLQGKKLIKDDDECRY